MKTLTYISKLALVMIFALGMFATAQAQTPEGTIEKVAKSIQAGDSEALSGFFNSSVEITIPGAENRYTSQQASFVMKDFFSDYPPSRFEIFHQGSSGATYYATGSTTTGKGNFDTNIFIKKAGEKYLITQIRFEAE